MTDAPISAEVRAFLDANFAGSTIDDGYFFVSINAPVWRLVRNDCIQAVVDKICDGRCWLVAVHVDPRSIVEGVRFEARQVAYRPDWNVDEEVTEWLVELRHVRPDLKALIAKRTSLGALVFIDPDRRLVLNVNQLSVYATSKLELDRFAQGIEDCFSGESKDT